MKAHNLRIPKLSLLAPIAASKLEVNAFKDKRAFFLGHPVLAKFVFSSTNLRPGKRSLKAKVEDKAGVYFVPAVYPGHRRFYKLHLFLIRKPPHYIC